MPWDWGSVLQGIPEKKRQYYEILHHQAELLPALPVKKATAIPITEETLEAFFLKAFEADRDFEFEYLEKRMKLLKNRWKRLCNQGTFLVYYPSTILRIVHDDTERKEVFQMRIFWGIRYPIDRYAHWDT